MQQPVSSKKSSSDRVFIHNLSFLASIGVLEWEKQQAQKLELDLELVTDIRPAASTDELALTVDYAAISAQVMAVAQAQHHDLLETVAEKIAAAVLQNLAVQQVDLTLRKPGAVPAATSVGVKISRQQTKTSALSSTYVAS